nr:immunoglobulin light chain junction region [Macaca mulatta]
CQQYNSLS